MDENFLHDIVRKTFSNVLEGSAAKDFWTDKGTYESTIVSADLDDFNIENDSFSIFQDRLSFTVYGTADCESQGLDSDGDILSEDINVKAYINIIIIFPKDKTSTSIGSETSSLNVSDVIIKANMTDHEIVKYDDKTDDVEYIPEYIQEGYDEEHKIDSGSKDCKPIPEIDLDEDEIPY